MGNDDERCPKCRMVIKGAKAIVSVAVYLHEQTPGECAPTERLMCECVVDGEPDPNCDLCAGVGTPDNPSISRAGVA